MTPVSTGVTQGCWCVSGHPAHPDFHGMIPSQQICLSFHQASNGQQKTSEPRPKRRERWRGEGKPPRTSSLLWQAHVACWAIGEGTQIRMLQVTGMMTSLGAFQIPWESVSLTFSHLFQLLNSPPLAWVGCQGLRVTQKHWKSIFPVVWKWGHSPISRCYLLYLFLYPGKNEPQRLHHETLTLLSEDGFLHPCWTVFPPCDCPP